MPLRDSTNFQSRLQAPRVQVEEQARVETPKRSAKGRQSLGTPLAFLIEKSLMGPSPQPQPQPEPAQGRPSLGGTPSKIPAPKVRASLGSAPLKAEDAHHAPSLVSAHERRQSAGGNALQGTAPSLIPAHEKRQSAGAATPQGIERTGSSISRNAPTGRPSLAGASTALCSAADKPVNKALANRLIAPGPSSILTPRKASSGPLSSKAGASSSNKPLRATPLRATPLKATPLKATPLKAPPPAVASVALSKTGAAAPKRRPSGGFATPVPRRLSAATGARAPITPQSARNNGREHAGAAGAAVEQPAAERVSPVAAKPSTPLFAPLTDTKSKLAQEHLSPEPLSQIKQ